MKSTEELKNWSYEKKCKEAVKALTKNGFTSIYCKNKKVAADYILNESKEATTIGFGGSMTVADLGIVDKLKALNKELLDHNMPGLTPEEKNNILRQQLLCDLFLTSANGVTLTGSIVNTDGNGNRIASMIFGPKKVIVVAGRNKLVDGVSEALKRIKEITAPANARRLNFNLPCAKTGMCVDCNSKERICNVTMIMERKPMLSDVIVLIINEDLGL